MRTTILLMLLTAGCVQPAKLEPTRAMKPYREVIPGTGVAFDMVPIPAGRFVIGSPASEPGHAADEGPQREVEVSAFWMGRCEVTWNEFELWMLDLDIQRRRVEKREPGPNDAKADAVTRPTKPYADMSFGMGQDGFPAISMTQLAAKYYCKWLSAKTGRYYRLPTEAEWEYACRAGSKTRYYFGDDASKLGDYAWYADNSDEKYHEVGRKKPNGWGLHDMLGNVCEWTLDAYDPKSYARLPQRAVDPYVQPTELFPRVTRGGSWEDEAEDLRVARRNPSNEDWKMQDPQIPQSMWYHTDAQFLGFRVVRPAKEPAAKQKAAYLAVTADELEQMKNKR